MHNKPFEDIWKQLRAKKSQYSEYLNTLILKNLRGIKDLQVEFDYPVTVLAGPNACGKTTVLFAAACAYDVPGSRQRDYVPSTMFPTFHPKKNQAPSTPTPSDRIEQTVLQYVYRTGGQPYQMQWKRGKNWNRSFMGKRGGKQPSRDVYLRTLANLSNPSEVRSVMQMAHREFDVDDLSADLIAFAQRILPMNYTLLRQISGKSKSLLFAQRADDEDAQYSEFQMSSGERAILHLSKDISRMKKGLILIDEVEAGLHPYTQQQFMLELQRLALREELQIIVTTHSPVVLDTVPPEGVVFLERKPDGVITRPAYRDIIQHALYGQSSDRLSILCEDRTAEALIQGLFDMLNPRLDLSHAEIVIGRDTGKEEFKAHINALGKFKELHNFVFVLDGDARDKQAELQAAARQYGEHLEPIFLPGDAPPEVWTWNILREQADFFAKECGIDPDRFKRELSQLDQVYDNAADTPGNIAKNKVNDLAERVLGQSSESLCRVVGQTQAEHPEMKPVLDNLIEAVERWRQS